MIVVNDIPLEWRSLLHTIQQIDPKAIIGGGCLRDLDREHQLRELTIKRDWDRIAIPPKDIDVFIHEVPYQLITVTEDRYGEFTSDSVSGEESAKADSTIIEQRLWEIKGLPPINILRCSSDIVPVERFARFDFGLCQIIFDGQRLLFTDAYLTDRHDKTFTLLRYTNDFAHANSLERFARFQAGQEYSGHSLVIPEGLIPPKLDEPELSDQNLT